MAAVGAEATGRRILVAADIGHDDMLSVLAARLFDDDRYVRSAAQHAVGTYAACSAYTDVLRSVRTTAAADAPGFGRT